MREREKEGVTEDERVHERNSVRETGCIKRELQDMLRGRRCERGWEIDIKRCERERDGIRERETEREREQVREIRVSLCF